MQLFLHYLSINFVCISDEICNINCFSSNGGVCKKCSKTRYTPYWSLTSLAMILGEAPKFCKWPFFFWCSDASCSNQQDY